MSANLDQIYTANPITVNQSTDLIYFMQSPYSSGTDAAMTFQNFSAQFATGALTSGYIFVGNSENKPNEVKLSTDFSYNGSGQVIVGRTDGVPFAASATTNTTNAANISAGTLVSARLSGSYTGITGVGTLTAGTWNASAISPQYGGTGVNNGTNELTLGGPLTLSGAFATVFNISAATNVTFPTSGTLATTADAGISTLDGDTGSATGSTVSINADLTGLTFSGSGDTLSLGGTLNVASGGTGATSYEAFSLVTTGDTSTAPFSTVPSPGSLGQFLQSQGSSSYPQFVDLSVLSSVNVQIFTYNSTYNPSGGMLFVKTMLMGGGAGGGSGVSSGTGYLSTGGGGAQGNYSEGWFSAGEVGGSTSITVGGGGSGGTSGSAGGSGGESSFGGLISAQGGNGGGFGNLGSLSVGPPGQPTSVSFSTSALFLQGAPGQGGFGGYTIGVGYSILTGGGGGPGGGYGFGYVTSSPASNNGTSAQANSGGGGSGGFSCGGAGNGDGGNGGSGYVIVVEFIA